MALLIPVLLAALTLALPGPTNALFVAAGTTGDDRQVLKLIGAAVFGYVVAVVAYVAMAHLISGIHHDAFLVSRKLAALICLLMAFHLWSDIARPPRDASVVAVFLATLVNPKALLLATILLSAVTDKASVSILLFCIIVPTLIASSALGWYALGRKARGMLSIGGLNTVRRGLAITMACFAAYFF